MNHEWQDHTGLLSCVCVWESLLLSAKADISWDSWQISSFPASLTVLLACEISACWAPGGGAAARVSLWATNFEWHLQMAWMKTET